MDKRVPKGDKKPTPGQAARFGFKKRPPPQHTVPPPVAQPANETVLETVQPLVIPTLQGATRLSRDKKDAKPPPNRFGFIPPTQLSNKVADAGSRLPLRPASVPSVKFSGRSVSETRVKQEPTNSRQLRFHPNLAYRRAPYHGSTESTLSPAAAIKLAKTAANNQTQISSANKNVKDTMEIQQLEQSPGAATKFGHTQRGARQLEMVFPSGSQKRFELREMAGPSKANPTERHDLMERIRREVVMSTDSEEKQIRDKSATEKTLPVQQPSTEEDDLWAGPGEAMAVEHDLALPNLDDIDRSPEPMNPPLRSVLLKIEDPTFASLAAFSTAQQLEDETSPESPDISICSVEPLPPPPNNIKSKPGTPDSPTHASNSLSSDAKDRDFLIDDEIADQPGLVFNSTRDEPALVDASRTIAQLAGQVSQALANVHSRPKDGRQSASTLSPCESIASDDFMADFDSISVIDENDDPNEPLKSEILNQSDHAIREWSTLLSTHPGLKSGLKTTQKKSLRGVQPSSFATSTPLGAQQGRSTPGDDNSSDSGVKLGPDELQSMYQEVVGIRQMLYELQKILGQAEVPNPLETTTTPLQNGGGMENGGSSHSSGEDGFRLHDLQRQIVLLELQLDHSHSRNRILEEELKVARLATGHRHKSPVKTSSDIKMINTATQTDRTRPLSTTLLQSTNNPAQTIVSSSEELEKLRCVSLLHYNAQ